MFSQLAQQVEDGKLGSRHADPERQPLVLVVVIMPVELPEQRLELPGVLADEERSDPVEEDRVGMDQVHGVGDGQALGPVPGAHPDKEVAPVAKQLHCSGS